MSHGEMVAALPAEAEHDVTAYAVVPRAHLRKLCPPTRSSWPTKSSNGDCYGVCVFPDDAVIRLVGAMLLEQHDDWHVADGRYVAEGSLALLDRIGQDADHPAERPAA